MLGLDYLPRAASLTLLGKQFARAGRPQTKRFPRKHTDNCRPGFKRVKQTSGALAFLSPATKCGKRKAILFFYKDINPVSDFVGATNTGGKTQKFSQFLFLSVKLAIFFD